MTTRHPLGIADGLPFPLDAITQKTALLGMSGSGKTNAMTVFAEEMLDAHAQIVLLDPKGEGYGLRLKKDGKTPGYPIPVFGGEHADVPLRSEMGARVAELIVKSDYSAILDLSEFTSGELAHFGYDFATTLLHLKKQNRSAMCLLLDECQEFIPQNPQPASRGQQNYEPKMLHAFERVQKQGRATGIGMIIAGQRPQEINKKVLNLCECWFTFRMAGLQERKTTVQIIGEKDKEAANAIDKLLPRLETGDAYIWSAYWLKVSATYHIRERYTFDSSATPEVGAKRVEARDLSPVDIATLTSAMHDVIERAKAEDPRELKRQIHDLKHQLATQPPPAQGIEAAAGRAVQQQEEMYQELQTQVGRLEREWQAILAARNGVIEKLSAKLNQIGALASQLASLADLDLDGLVPDGNLFPHFDPAIHVIKGQAPRDGIRPSIPGKPEPMGKPVYVQTSSNSEGLTGTQRQILDTILMLDLRSLPATRDSVARWMNKHPSGGRYGSDLATLRAQGYIEGLTLTDKGKKAARPRATGTAAAREALKDDSQRRIFNVLLESKHKHFTRDSLAEALELHPSGGRYGSNLAWLRTMGLIPDRGAIFLTDGAYA